MGLDPTALRTCPSPAWRTLPSSHGPSLPTLPSLFPPTPWGLFATSGRGGPGWRGGGSKGRRGRALQPALGARPTSGGTRRGPFRLHQKACAFVHPILGSKLGCVMLGGLCLVSGVFRSLLNQGLVHTRVWRRKQRRPFRDCLHISAVLRVRGRKQNQSPACTKV